ncbi:MAG: N-6 DNA methylase [Caldilineaceae bacterium]|nr:N-6 DNA methylase [Caldilineaceae bacterium]
MTTPIPRDQAILSQSSSELEEAVTRSGLEESPDLRIRLLEGASAKIGGFDLHEFDLAIGGIERHIQLPAAVATSLASKLAAAAKDCPIPASLAIAALGDTNVDFVARRRQGRYFTDSRLALSLASSIREQVLNATSILDPSCGAGTLLIAATLQLGTSAECKAHAIRHLLWGVDRDFLAVRAARTAIASLTDDLEAVANLSRRLLVADSLTSERAWWNKHSIGGFDLVIGNPPWERLRVTRHEHVLGTGHHRHYGDAFHHSQIDEKALLSDRKLTSTYRARISSELTLQGEGESALHRMFLELSARLTSESGALAILIPAGFIKNFGARQLREWLFRNFDVDILILDNRERYFAIDSRFKFIKLLAKRNGKKGGTVHFGTECFGSNSEKAKVKTDFGELKRIQTDLSLPEVRDLFDWKLFTRLRQMYSNFGSTESGWKPQFHREVDMTNDRPKFKNLSDDAKDLPVIEGRMVHHHRVSAKRYVSGRGRRAKWRVQALFHAPLGPQWQIGWDDLRPPIKSRTLETRAGFCDITGQTNERTVLAALIPKGVVCGNKVPTIKFSSDAQAQTWVGIANSFTFDWLTRRSITTTLNFFMLRSLPIPKWDAEGEIFRAIANATQSLADMERSGKQEGLWHVGRIRAKIEVLTASLYGVSVAEFDQMLRDFPLIDQSQPALPGEKKSTITRDLVVASSSDWASPSQMQKAENRVKQARCVGAVPYIPNEHAKIYGGM